MFQESEVIILGLALVACRVASPLLRNPDLPGRLPLLAGFCAMIAAHFFTVAEGVFWPVACNILEHIALAASGIAFALAMLRMRTILPQREG
jgi:hypothetical protein